MLIENAFWKLPELLTSNFDHRSLFEGNLANKFCTALFMELNARNYNITMRDYITTEKPYPKFDDLNHNYRVDAYVNLGGIYASNLRMSSYGAKDENWIELKAFTALGRGKNSGSKNSNASEIARDLIRLCSLIKELKGSIRENGRYMLIVFNSPPENYLPSNIEWLTKLLTPGDSEINLVPDNELKIIRDKIGDGFKDKTQFKLKVQLSVHSFQPLEEKVEPLFWGYLIRIRDFTMNIGDMEFQYEDRCSSYWSREKDNIHKAILEQLIEWLKQSKVTKKG